jgi:hypothetical protein
MLELLDITRDRHLSLFEVGHRRIGATRKALAERAVTSEANDGLAFDAVLHTSAEASTFHMISHSALHPDRPAAVESKAAAFAI